LAFGLGGQRPAQWREHRRLEGVLLVEVGDVEGWVLGGEGREEGRLQLAELEHLSSRRKRGKRVIGYEVGR